MTLTCAKHSTKHTQGGWSCKHINSSPIYFFSIYFIQKGISEFKCVRVLLDFIIARILTNSYVRKEKKINILSLWVLIRIMIYDRPHKPAHRSMLKCQSWEPASRTPPSMPFKIWDTRYLVSQGCSSKCQSAKAYITELYRLTLLEAKGPKSRCWLNQGWFFPEGCEGRIWSRPLWGLQMVFSGCLFTSLSSMHVCVLYPSFSLL